MPITMDTLLWIVQGILAIKLLSVAYTHALRQDLATMQTARQRLGDPARPLLRLVALCTLLAAGGMLLPGLLGWSPLLTPLVAISLVGMLLMSLYFHLVARQQPKLFVSLVLLAMAAFVAWGRWPGL